MATFCKICSLSIKKPELVYCTKCDAPLHDDCAEWYESPYGINESYCLECEPDDDSCPDFCPSCGEEGSVVNWGGECYCQVCNYYL